MMSPDEIARLVPAETARFRSPIPVQSVSSDEFMPPPQTPRQREFEARVKAIGSELANDLVVGAIDLKFGLAGDAGQLRSRGKGNAMVGLLLVKRLLVIVGP